MWTTACTIVPTTDSGLLGGSADASTGDEGAAESSEGPGSSGDPTETSTSVAGETVGTLGSSTSTSSEVSTSSSTSTWGDTTGLDSSTGPVSAEDTSLGDSGEVLPADCEGGSQIDVSMVGWATENGGTTGGRGGDTITVDNGADLVQALNDKQDSSTPLTIWVSGTITPENSGVDKIDIKDVTDVSILGMGQGADFAGIGLKITRASNIVLRNLIVHNVDIGDKDAISIEGPADHIWVDHCELYAELDGVDKDYYDGLLDAKAEAEYITYSWNYLHDSWKASLVGSSDSDDFDRKITMHHNHYRNCNSRLPLFRFGNGHVFNNYYEDIIDSGINSRMNACLKIENNYFSNAKNPWLSAYSDEVGAGELVCNVVTDGSHFEISEGDDQYELSSCVANVPYAYAATLNTVDAVPAIVSQNAGVGHLTDPSDF